MKRPLHPTHPHFQTDSLPAEAQAFVKRQNAASREVIYRGLDALGLRYVKSQGNMVFFHTGRPASDVAAAFAAHGMTVLGPPLPVG